MNLLDTVRKELGEMDRGMKVGDGTAISESLRNLDDLVRTNRDRLPGRLLHFLERRSYQKALEFLEADRPADDGVDTSV